MDNQEPAENKDQTSGDLKGRSGNQPAEPSGSDAQNKGKAGSKRKVAKTKLEVDFSPTDLTEEESRLIEGLLTQKPSKRKVAKTMLDTSLPTEALEAIGGQAAPAQSPLASAAPAAESKPAAPERSGAQQQPPAQAPGKRKVAKTMLETSIPLGAGAESFDEVVSVVDTGAAVPPASPAPPAQVPAASRRKVAKTMLETDIPDDCFEEAVAIVQPQSQPSQFPTACEPSIPAEPKPKRKIAKTMLETAIPDVFFEEAVSVVDPESTEAPPVKRLKRVSKTLLELPTDFLSGESLTGTSINPEMAAEPAPAGQRFVAKTMLDLSVLDAALERAAKKKEEQAMELAKERASQPVRVIEPVKADRYARMCPWRWDGMGEKDRYRYCGQCHLPVYNFDGLDRAEADAIIYIREDRRNCSLYERSDGKFMTSDCAIAVQRQRNFLMLIVGGTIAVIGVLTLILMIPKPQPTVSPNPTPDPFQATTIPGQPGLVRGSGTPGAQTRSSSSSASSRVPGSTSTVTPGATPGSNSSTPGIYHYHEGEPLPHVSPTPPVAAPSPTPVPVPEVKTAQPDPDESGDFWQYSNRGGGNN